MLIERGWQSLSPSFHFLDVLFCMREKELSCRVIFVRHGQTDFPIDRIYCDDKENPELNADGKRQAESAARFLREVDIDAIYASPVRRTRMTAEAIAKYHGLSVEFDQSLVERHFGIWEGLYFDEVERDYPDEFVAWKRDQAGFAPQGGESAYDLFDRVSCFLQKIIAENRGRTIVVVTHVGPIRVLVAQAVGMSIDSFRVLRIDPASLTRVDFGSKQNNLVFLNYVDDTRMVNL